MEFTIYTDGGCSGNKRDANCPGAWAYIVLDPGNNIFIQNSNREENTTNNRMEMTAAINALKDLIEKIKDLGLAINKQDVIIYTDSMYMSGNFNDYLLIWKKNNWIKSDRAPVINSDLWKLIDLYSHQFGSFEFIWVKGHSVNPYNQKVDQMVRDHLY